MKINIDDIINIQGGVKNISVTLDKIDMSKDFAHVEFYKPIKLDGILESDKGNIHLSGTLRTKVKVPCDRCMSQMIYCIETEVTESFGNDTDLDGNPYEPITASSVDLGPTIVETTLVSLPMKSVCEQDCKGMCPKCGQNLNIKSCDCEEDIGDPRLEKFGLLFKDNNKDSNN